MSGKVQQDPSPAVLARLFDLDAYAEGYPFEAWRHLRQHDPVHYHEHSDYVPFWAITKHADIAFVGRRSDLFTSTHGVLVPTKLAQSNFGNVTPSRRPGRSILDMDPPEHTDVRGTLRDRFAAHMLAGFEPVILNIVRKQIDEAAAMTLSAAAQSGRTDFVTEIAAQIPLRVIMLMLGVPESERERFLELRNAFVGVSDPEYQRQGASVLERYLKVTSEYRAYFLELIATRRTRLGDDLVSVMIEARPNGEPLHDETIAAMCLVLSVGGHETTRNSATAGLMALCANPDQAQALRQGSDTLWASAVEEVLRWASPVIYMARAATENVTLRKRTISKGARVALFYHSANRDEDVFDTPDTFDIHRTKNPHLTFGFGRHACLGANLARIELKALLREVLARFPRLEIESVSGRVRSNFLGGTKHLWVRLNA